jgi:hypothetical protein
MLLVTFHGGSSGINNVYAYHTDGKLKTKEALDHSKDLSELRAMVLANGLLYVANGAKSESAVLAYKLPGSGASRLSASDLKQHLFTYASTLIASTLSKKGHFETSIAHPFGIVFENAATCYISNQDTNVVSQVSVGDGGESGSLGEGCQSAYLNQSFPNGTFLDGTYVASQVGTLPDVSVEATPVDHAHGGLGVSFEKEDEDKGKKPKVKNSVRDVAIADGMLFVCDEPEKVVDLYLLPDGSYLGSSNGLDESPTHLAIDNGGLYVSAGSKLYWGPLQQSPGSFALQPIALTPPSSDNKTNKIGGISFDGLSPATVYIPFQAGTGGNTPGGSIYSYSVSQQTPSTLPVLSKPAELVSSLTDTPEFVLYWSGGS